MKFDLCQEPTFEVYSLYKTDISIIGWQIGSCHSVKSFFLQMLVEKEIISNKLEPSSSIETHDMILCPDTIDRVCFWYLLLLELT